MNTLLHEILSFCVLQRHEDDSNNQITLTSQQEIKLSPVKRSILKHQTNDIRAEQLLREQNRHQVGGGAFAQRLDI